MSEDDAGGHYKNSKSAKVMALNEAAHKKTIYTVKNAGSSKGNLHNYADIQRRQKMKEQLETESMENYPYSVEEYEEGYQSKNRGKLRHVASSLAPSQQAHQWSTERKNGGKKIYTEPLPQYNSGGDQLFNKPQISRPRRKYLVEQEPKQRKKHRKPFQSQPRSQKKFLDNSTFLPVIHPHAHHYTEPTGLQNVYPAQRYGNYDSEQIDELVQNRRIIAIQIPHPQEDSQPSEVQQQDEDSDKQLLQILASNQNKLERARKAQEKYQSHRTPQKDSIISRSKMQSMGVRGHIEGETQEYLNQCELIIKNLKDLTAEKIQVGNYAAKYSNNQKFPQKHINIVNLRDQSRQINLNGCPYDDGMQTRKQDKSSKGKIQASFIQNDSQVSSQQPQTGRLGRNEQGILISSIDGRSKQKYLPKNSEGTEQKTKNNKVGKQKNKQQKGKEQSLVDFKRQKMSEEQATSTNIRNRIESQSQLRSAVKTKLSVQESHRQSQKRKQQFMMKYLSIAKARGQSLQRKLLKFNKSRISHSNQKQSN